MENLGERDIRGLVDTLAESLRMSRTAPDVEAEVAALAVAAEAGQKLLTQALVDLSRCASAMEWMAQENHERRVRELGR